MTPSIPQGKLPRLVGSLSRFRIVNGQRVLTGSPYRAPSARARELKPIDGPPPPMRGDAKPQKRWPGSVLPQRYLPFGGPTFTVSVAAYRCVAQTWRCLDLVARCSPADIEVLLTDNGSPPVDAAEMERMCSSFGPRFRLVRHAQNLGFGAAHTHALGLASGVYFAVLNNDVDVKKGWLEEMRALLVEDPDVAVVGPHSSAMHVDADVRTRPISPEHADYVEGSCLMMRTAQARKLGMFDPDYTFAYCEDADLSLRVRKRGWRIAFTSMRLDHQRAVTASLVRKEGRIDIDGHMRRNQQLFAERWDRYLRHRSFGERVLVRRSAARGDVLWITPILRAIRTQNAHAEVWVETSVPDALINVPFVDHVVTKVDDAQQFDQVIDLDLSYERTPKRRVIESYAAAAGFEMSDVDHVPIAIPTKDDRSFVREQLTPRSYVVMHPAVTGWPGRNWSIERWSEVSQRFRERGLDVAVVGFPSTPVLSAETHDMRGLTAGRTAAVIESALCFVGVDAFPMHIAQAMLTPIVATYGAVDPKWWLLPIPFYRAARASGVPCLGCHHERKPPVTDGTCHQARVYCMDYLTADDVMREFDLAMDAWGKFWETGKVRNRILRYCEGEGIDLGCGRDKVRDDALGFDDDTWPEVDDHGDVSGLLPYLSESFDYVYSSHALEDLSDTRATLQEWSRILRRGGHMTLVVPTTGCFTGVNLDHVHEGWRASELGQIVNEVGLDVVEAFEDVEHPHRYSTVVVGRKR